MKNAIANAVGAALATQADIKKYAVSEEDAVRIKQEGSEFAKQLQTKIAGEGITIVEIMIHVAKFDHRAEAVLFVESFKEQAEVLSKAGSKEEAMAGAMVLQHASRLNRVVRAVFGWTVKDKDTKVKTHVYGEGFSGGKDANGRGRESTLKILQGKEGWKAKMDKLPRTNIGPRDTPTETPIQRRLTAVDKVMASSESLAAVLGVSGKAVAEPKERDKASRAILTAAIKQCPETELPGVIGAVINRCMASSDETLKEWGINARDHLKALNTKEPGQPTRRSVKAKEKVE